MLIKHFLYNNIIRSITALLLAIMLLALTGCGDETKKPSEGSSKEPVSSVDSNSSEEVSEPSDVKKPVLSLGIDSTFTVNDKVDSRRDDFGEPLYEDIAGDGKNIANLYNPLTGYAEAETEALRSKILNSKNTDEIYNITGTKYYVSPGGSDENDGKSPETPIRTLGAIGGLSLKKGDAVLLERGSVFRTANTISTRSDITYGSYGNGDKPKIYAAPVSLANPVLWTPTKTKNVWVADYAYKEVGGVFFNHGEIVGFKKNKVKELLKDYDFYHDEDSGMLYLRFSGGNPGAKFNSIEASTSIYIFTIGGASNVTIDNLCLKYSGYMGIHGNTCDGATITNCELGFIGGKNYDAKQRFGNAIEIFGIATNLRVENNWIYQTFDSAITWQCNVEDGVFENISVKNNLLEYNHTDIEYWNHVSHSLSNISIDNNIMRFNSLGWGSRMEDAIPRGFEGPIAMTSDTTVAAKNLTLNNNIIDCPARRIFKWDYNPGFETALSMTGNKIFVKNSLRTTDVVLRTSPNKILDATDLNTLVAAFSQYTGFGTFDWYE